jgi:DNA-binding IscR family transcriptional regulator
MNGRFSIAMNIMTLLCSEDRKLSSEYMAGSINVNPVLIRKELSNLIKHHLIISQQGKNGGYALGKPATDLSLASIYNAVKPDTILGKAKNQPNPNCAVGKQINTHLNILDQEIEQNILNKLGDTSLAEFCKRFD